jgi:hypothetical protein
LSVRLFGNRDLAAQYWGEARRLAFILKNRMSLAGIPSAATYRTYVDGTTIRVASIFGQEIVEINSPFHVEKREEREEKSLYILCYWQSGLYKIYRVSFSRGSGIVAETDLTHDFDIQDASGGSAVAIITDNLLEKLVICYDLSYGDWVHNRFGGSFTPNQNIEYADRYIYVTPGWHDGAIYQVGHRLIDRFGSTNRTSYLAPRYFYPKLDVDHVDWTHALHSAYGILTDIKGKNNITLDEEKTYAVSWGERIHEQGDASYSFNLNAYGTVYTNPFPGNPAGWHISYHGKFAWPIVGTLNARKAPKIYSLQYENESGTHTIGDFLTETLTFNYVDAGDTQNGTQSYSGSSVNFWILAAIGDKKAAYLKNSLSESGGGNHETIITGSTPYGDLYHKVYAYNHQEALTQEFYVGEEIIETLSTDVSHNRFGSHDLTMPTDPNFLEEFTDEMTFQGTFRWIEPLDYCNHKGNFICLYKKIAETISVIFNSHWSGPYQGPYSGSANKTINTTRQVEYWLAWKIGNSWRKKLLATFNCGHTGESHDNNGVLTHSSSHSGSGERIYGASVQLASPYAAFSFNKETFKGVGSHDYYKSGLGFNGTVNRWMGIEMGMIENYHDPLPYPFPLEDANTYLDSEESAWQGHFCVGAIIDNQVAIGSFANQTSKVAATGIIRLHST